MMNAEETVKNLENHEQRLVSMEHRVKELEYFQRTQNDLVISVNKLALNMEGMLTEQKEQGVRLRKLENEPADRWNSAKKTAFTTIISVIAGAMATGMILMIAQYV